MRRLALGTVIAFLALVGAAQATAPVLTHTGTVLEWTKVSSTAEYRVEYCAEVMPTKPCNEGGWFYLRPNEPRSWDTSELTLAAGSVNEWRVQKFPSGEWSNVVSITVPEKAVTVNAKPTGPSGEWTAEFADGFGAALGSGTGQDPNWLLKEQGYIGNADEISVIKPEGDKTDAEGLELPCTYHETEVTVESRKSHYVCSMVEGDQHFEFPYGGEQSIVVETVARWPVTTGNADPGFWSYTSDEADWFEGWGWNGTSWATATAGMPVLVTPYEAHKLNGVTGALGFDPSAGFHRYTTEISPSGSEDLVREWVDGTFKWEFKTAIPVEKDGFLISNVMRKAASGVTATGFTGSRNFTIRSVALYEDTAHAGSGIFGGGVAPGTVVK